MTPTVQAFKDYKNGGGQNDNPYPKESQDWWSYALEMNRLQMMSFAAEQDELRGGV